MSFQQEAVREWAWIVGAERPDQEYLLSNYDSWEKNPHYRGAPGRHPEDWSLEDEVEDGPRGEFTGPPNCDGFGESQPLFDDEIPF